MSYLFPGVFALTKEPALSAQAPPTDANPTLSPARMLYSTLLQLRTHVETEKLERRTLKRLVLRLQTDFAPLQPKLKHSINQP